MWKLNLNSFFLSNFEKKFGRLQILLREKTGFCDNIFRDKLYLQFVCLFVCVLFGMASMPFPCNGILLF